jgi:TRAP-type C4-dicarboxylate transport system permease small subunit
MVFMGAIVAIARDNHIKITFLVDRIPPKGKHGLVLFSYSVVVLFTLIVLFGSIQLVQLNWGQEAVTFPISVGVLYLALTVFSGVSLILMIFLVWNRLKILLKKSGNSS